MQITNLVEHIVEPKVGDALCGFEGENVDLEASVEDQFFIMLVFAYIMLILPVFNMLIFALCSGDRQHVAGSNIPGFASIAAGSLFLSFYYKNDWTIDQTEMVHNILKSYIGMSLAIVFIGCAFIIQLCFSFLSVLLCAKCCSGERAIGLLAFVFTLAFLVVIFSCPLGNVIIGWKYTFEGGACSNSAYILVLANAIGA